MGKHPEACPIIITPENFTAFSEDTRNFLDTVGGKRARGGTPLSF